MYFDNDNRVQDGLKFLCTLRRVVQSLESVLHLGIRVKAPAETTW